jgi:hypothetical protein
MVKDAVEYRWSTSAAHCGAAPPDAWLDAETFAAAWNPGDWREGLGGGTGDDELAAIRRNTHTGRPLGGGEFVARLEQALGRKLAPGRGGRPTKMAADARQSGLFGTE